MSILKINSESTHISNPFVNKIKLEDDIKPNRRNLIQNFSSVYILSKMKEEPLPNNFYEGSVPYDLFSKYKSQLVLSEASNCIILNSLHMEKMVILDSHFLSQFNHFGLELDDTNLVLPIFNVSYLNIQSYLKQYDNDYKLNDVVKMIVLNLYFSPYKNELVYNNYINTITNIRETRYWTLKYNCKLNITDQIRNRNFHFEEYIRRNTDKENSEQMKTIMGQLNLEEDSYMQLIYKSSNKNWVDASNAITKNGGRRCYKISNFDCDYNKYEINNIFSQLKTKEVKFYFFNSLLISKKYSHLALNNENMLKNMKPFFEKYAPLYRYLFGYAWLRFVLEENIKKSYISHEDEFIFDIHTANKLPWFPFILEDPTLNPYFPLLVNKNALNTKKNIGGVSFKKVNDMYHYGITTLDDFRRRLNIFITSNSEKNYFNNIDWKNIAITGSVMPACLLKNPVLLELFENVKYDYQTNDMGSSDFKYHRLYKEYYNNSDVDIMVNINDKFKFIDRTLQFYEEICNNVVIYNNEAKNSNVTLVPIKKTFVILNDKFIKNKIVNEKYTFDYIVNNLNKDDTLINLILPFYTKEKHKLNEEKLKDVDEENIPKVLEKYKVFFDFFNLENKNDNNTITFLYIDSRSEHKKVTTKVSVKNDSNLSLKNDSIDEELFIVKENLKFKMKSPYMNRCFEIFPIKYENFFSSVARFHLPCVRAYYNGDNVYMTPTCISSYMTYTNLNYKYFAGTNDPIEIINKYRMRGFGTILNSKEILHLLHYSSKVSKWKKLYGLNNIKNKSSRENILGNLVMSKHKILQPLLYSEQVLYPLPYNEINNSNRYYSKDDLYEFYNNISTCFSSGLLDFKKINFINKFGYVEPLNKSIIKLTWDSCKYIKNKETFISKPPGILAPCKNKAPWKKINIKHNTYVKKKIYSSNNDGW